jgi:Cellulose biosynthesis protein BcsN
MEIADMKRLWLALVALSLAGCASGGNVAGSYESLAVGGEPEKTHEFKDAREIDKRDLLARIPSWAGEIQHAREYREAGLLRQEIVFAGGTRGDHMIEVTLAERGANPAELHRPSDSEIEAELATRFPGVAMKIVPQDAQGAAGADRVAIGRASDGTRCLYDWRWADDVRVAADPSGIAAVTAAFSQKATPALLRVRLCSKYVSLDDLASLARQIQFAPIPDIDRIVNGGAPNPGAVKPGEVRALAPTLESALACGAGETPAPERAKRSSPRSEKKLAHRTPTVKSGATYSADAESARFLAAPPIAASGDLEVSAGRPAAGARDLDLPAAAYRGPAAGTAPPTSSAQ